MKKWLDNYGKQANYNDSKATASPDMVGDGFSNVGRNYSPAWGGQFQTGGKLKFLQPTSDKLPEGYRIPYDTPSTERASSIGGTNGEPAYLVPEFKYGQPIYDSIEEFKRTGEHLGGPFKTWQEAEEWENTVRHPAVENRETIMFPQEKFQTGGSIPGSVGFTYARTKGIPSNGPYAKKTLASAQNGVDMYGNPITAELKYDQSVNRTNYNPRTNQMIFGNDMPYFLSQEKRDKTLAHENRHAWQFANDRTNFNIVHTPEYAFQDRLKKKPEQPSTDEVFNSYHDRKQKEVAIDVNKFKASYPELSFMPDELIYKRFVDSQQYDNPLSVEGEAQYYENTGERSFQNGGEMKFYQNGLDFKPKSISRDGGWLNKYDQAQNGKKKFKLKDESLQAIKPSESTFVKKPNFEAEQAKVQRTYVDQVGKQMAEEKRRKKLTKDQREREDYNARNEQTGSIQTPIEESTWDRTKAIASNPLTAFGYAARNQSLPTRFQHGERNTLDNAIDWVNPLQGAAALSEIPGELGRGEFLNAGLSALDAADLGVYARGAKQLKNINPEGKVFNGLNKQLDDIAIKNTEKYMAKRTPSNTPLSKEMNPQLLDNFDPGEYTSFQEDDYMKWFNEQKSKLNPRPVKQDPRSIVRSSSVIDINDMKEGGVVKDDMGQWKYPGQITEIGSNQITMQGVPYPVLGISDTGDTKLMKPGKDYKFKGKKVTEFPMAKNGIKQELNTRVKDNTSVYNKKPKKNILKEKMITSGTPVVPINKGNWLNRLIAENITPYGYLMGDPSTMAPNKQLDDITWESSDKIKKLNDKYGYKIEENESRGTYSGERFNHKYTKINNPDLYKKESKKIRDDRNKKLLSITKNISDNKLSEKLKGTPRPERLNASQDALNLHQGIPQKYNSFVYSEYKPSKSKENKQYYSLAPQYEDEIRQDLFERRNADFINSKDKFRQVKGSHIADASLKDYQYSKGRDEKGDYIAYYDVNDYGNILDILPNSNPFEIYGRIYYDKKTGKPIPKQKNGGEFPMAKNGRRQEQKGLQNLEDLTNFTNYSKQQLGGWLEAYK